MPATPTCPLKNVVALDSSSLMSVAYDSERTTLEIQFRDRSIYQYIEVPETIHQDLLHAVSKGDYFNKHVRNRFASTKVRHSPVLG